jgi:hypothetical protein
MVYDLDRKLASLQKYQQRVVLHPRRWRSFKPATPLTWESVRFGSGSVQDVPQQRGIYTFVVHFQDYTKGPFALPTHGYILYGGITGARAQHRTLRDRFQEYLREKQRGKRVNIHRMLNTWPKDLFFYYAVVGQSTDLGALELALNDAVIPPFVENDFSAAVRPLVKALRSH